MNRESPLTRRSTSWRAAAFAGGVAFVVFAFGARRGASAEPLPEAPAEPPADPAPPPADQARGLLPSDPYDPREMALLLPRAVLGMTRVAFDVATLPIVGAARLEDRYHVVSWLEDLFYNDARTAAIIPVVSLSTFQGAGGGVLAFHDDLFGHREQLRLRAQFEGTENQSYELSFRAGDPFSIAAMVRYESADDLLFRGVGADGPEESFAQDRFIALLRGARRFGVAELGVTGIYNHRDLDPGTVGESYDLMSIHGFDDETIETFELQADLGIQTRPFRAKTFAGFVDTDESSLLHWGAEATVALDLWAPERVLYLRASVEGVEGDDVPFTELPRLGGPSRLRGYPLDRFRGDLALLGTVEYRYPVHQYVAGSLFLDAGHVTDNDWRAGGGMGIVIHGRKKVIATLQLSYGEDMRFFISTDPLQAFARKDTEL